jgi:EAL domain-containing protein (putative c-di-GMP-specific phosphodiesterase class I)
LITIAEYYGVDLRRIHFEITETAMIDLDDLCEMMNKLIERGSSFSLDDYGTGYSNLISVIGLPLSVIKIDKSVVWSYFRDKNQLLPHLIKMFSEEGFKVLCEGIEDLEMKESVEKMGANLEQGYYYSRPLSARDFISFMNE